MPKSWYVEIDDSDLQQAVNSEIPKAISDAVGQTLEEAANEIYSSATSSAPVDTGELRNSISKDVNSDEFTVQASADHAGYVEFGTRKMSAQPYFYNNANRVTASIHSRIESALSQNLPD